MKSSDIKFHEIPSCGNQVVPRGRTDRQTDRQADRQTARRTDGQTDGQTETDGRTVRQTGMKKLTAAPAILRNEPENSA